MNDPMPPAERPLDPEARAAIRARLLSDEQGLPRRRTPWLVPAAAAAAVVLAIGVVAALDGEADTSSIDPGPAAPAETSAASPEPSEKQDCERAPDLEAALLCEGQRNQTQELDTGDITAECAAELPFDGGMGVVELSPTTLLFEKGSRWVVCDGFAMKDGGVPTLLSVYDDAAYGLSKDAVAISMNFTEDEQQFFAAGKNFDGITQITYTFPDGVSVPATMSERGWVMDYQPTDGALTKPRLPEEPILVTFEGRDAAYPTFELQWGADTCAQTNHGC